MTINCNGNLIDLSTPKIMGILNITPDSFYDGGKHKDAHGILKHVEKMLVEGATFIDVGAYSSRPGAPVVSESLELKRILPIIELILKKFPDTLISIDTFRGAVAKACIALGATIINDISAGLRDNSLFPTVAELKVPYIMMHMKGTSKTMQAQTAYEGLIKDILFFFSERLATAKAMGIKDIIIDPGFGFAKTLAQNYVLLNKLALFHMTDHPVLVGLSRKSMIYKLLENTPEEALNGTTALNMVALNKGANILRVHDVKEAMECVKLHEQLEA